MPSWGEILQELQQEAALTGVLNFDGVRRKYLGLLHAKTGRNVVVYASDWLGSGGPESSINLADMQGLMEAFYQLQGPNLDLILHSPGGSPEAADRLVRYMRSKFNHVRVFVPLAAMSAATMWALAADEIWMGKHSQLGPIDPQLSLTLPNGQLYQAPARSLREQFEEAADDVKNDPSRLTTWLPILQQYAPGLLKIAEDAEVLGRQLVAEWLERYMFNGQERAKETAANAAEFFADAALHKSHSRAIDRDQVRELGLTVKDLEDDPEFQDLVLSVHHAVMHTLGSTATVKVVENHLGRAYMRASQQVQLNVGGLGHIFPQQPPG